MEYLPGTYILKCPNCERMETISGTVISFGKRHWPSATSLNQGKDSAMPALPDLESATTKTFVDEILRNLPVRDVMASLTARFPDATIADLCMAYAKLLIWVRETNTPHELLPVTKVYQASDDQFEEHVLSIGGETPHAASGMAKVSAGRDRTN
jgi:hypothetical protein